MDEILEKMEAAAEAVENPNFCLFCGAKMDGIHE